MATDAPVIRFEAGHVDSGVGAALVQAMRDEMAVMYGGLDLDSDAMPRAGAAELSPPRGAFLVGHHDDAPVCCGGLKRLDDLACEIKRMYVVPAVRGRGVARTLLHELEDTARSLGYAIARLDTGPEQLGARRLYQSEGYVEVANFNGNPVASFWGEKPLGRAREPASPRAREAASPDAGAPARAPQSWPRPLRERPPRARRRGRRGRPRPRRRAPARKRPP